jgi:hypothetical protein
VPTDAPYLPIFKGARTGTAAFTLLQEVHNREPCDSGFTLVCLGIGKKNPREQSVGERSTAGESPSQGRYYTPKLELLDFFVNRKGQQTLLSPAWKLLSSAMILSLFLGVISSVFPTIPIHHVVKLLRLLAARPVV